MSQVTVESKSLNVPLFKNNSLQTAMIRDIKDHKTVYQISILISNCTTQANKI